jgi:hypothetical protein
LAFLPDTVLDIKTNNLWSCPQICINNLKTINLKYAIGIKQNTLRTRNIMKTERQSMDKREIKRSLTHRKSNQLKVRQTVKTYITYFKKWI